MNEKLIIVTTDMEIDMAIFVDATKVADAKQVISEAQKKYYDRNGSPESIYEVVSKVMREHKIAFRIVEYEEI